MTTPSDHELPPKPRIPPGQSETRKFPVLTYGATPKIDTASWDFRVHGSVEEPARWSFSEFHALPSVTLSADFHCVTGWSQLDNDWTGVHIRELFRHVIVRPEARFVMCHCDGGYTTNVALEVLLDDDVLLAYGLDGEDLPPDHGGPLRLVVPKRYAWKSAKWLRSFELMADDRPGFWEQHGYHMDGDPWREERFG